MKYERMHHKVMLPDVSASIALSVPTKFTPTRACLFAVDTSYCSLASNTALDIYTRGAATFPRRLLFVPP